MKRKYWCALLFAFLFASRSFGQAPGYEYFITANANLYLPINNPEKGMYPILWYDKETDAKLLIGGFGIGISAFKPLQEKLSLKGQASISKHAYWDEPILFRDENANPSGEFQAGSADYALGITAMAHYFFTPKMTVGTGLGGQLLLVSLSRMPDINDHLPAFVVNRYYRPVMPVLPVELAYKTSRHLFTVRYEQGLLNRLKKDFKGYKTDKFGLFTFEVGFKLN